MYTSVKSLTVTPGGWNCADATILENLQNLPRVLEAFGLQ